MRLSEKLIQLRKSKGWTQAIAARNIDIQQSYLSKLENGRYIPSEEVIEKLCQAYDVSKSDLLPTTKPSHIAKYWLLALLLGITLSIVGYLGVFYPQTYYTYKVTPVSESLSTSESLSYHLTDQYNGERYVTTFSNVTYEYELIAERNVIRKENRWLIALGLILSIVSVSIPLAERWFKPKA